MSTSDFDLLPFKVDPANWLGFVQGKAGGVEALGDSQLVQHLGTLTQGQARAHVERSLLVRVMIAIGCDTVTSLEALAGAMCRWVERTPELGRRGALHMVTMDGELAKVGGIYLSRFDRVVFAHDGNPIDQVH